MRVDRLLARPFLVLAIWGAIAGVLYLTTPNLAAVVEKQDLGALPAGAPSAAALAQMDQEFGTGRSKSFLLVVIENKDGLTKADATTYRRLVAALRADKDAVADIQDYISTPALRRALVSKDGQATYIPLGLTAEFGSPQATEQLAAVREEIGAVGHSATTDIYVTGDSALAADVLTEVEKSSTRTEIASVVIIVVILAAIYRRFVPVILPLLNIAIASGITRSILAVLGEHGLPLSTFSEGFVLAIVLGAGTDYSIFLVSRFREEYRDTDDVRAAVATAWRHTALPLAASALTVAIACAILTFTQLSIFKTTGAGMAIAVLVTIATSLTVTPALLVVFGRRIGPVPLPKPGGRWDRVAGLLVARPVRVLIVGAFALAVMAAFAPGITLNYDPRSGSSDDVPSVKAFSVLDEHFGKYATQPNYVLIRTKKPLTSSADLAAIETLTRELASVDGVASVASITQPSGRVLKQTQIATQAETVGKNLARARKKLVAGAPGLTRLSDGTGRIASGAEDLGGGTTSAREGARSLTDGLRRSQAGLERSQSGARRLGAASDRLARGSEGLADGLATSQQGAARAVGGLDQIIDALTNDTLCRLDPVCVRSLRGLRDVRAGLATGLVPGLGRASSGARDLAQGQRRLGHGIDKLATGLGAAAAGQKKLAGGSAQLADGLDQLADGAHGLAAGLARIAPGIAQLGDGNQRLADGLGTAAAYLSAVGRSADTPETAGFYLPAQAIDSHDFALARQQFISADGRTARIQLITSEPPSSPDGIATLERVREVVEADLGGSPLAGSQVSYVGTSATTTDLQHYFVDDFVYAIVAVLITVLLLLVLTFRAIVAPLFLLGTVVLSYGAAIGLTYLVFVQMLGQAYQYSVPVLAFVLLVAVGVDYNILLMSRMREAGRPLTRTAVAEAVSATGPIITSAGLIFAGSFAAMMFSPIGNVSQMAFAMVCGLLLDTFVVRTLIVPSIAAMLGDRSWWPGGRFVHRRDDVAAAR